LWILIMVPALATMLIFVADVGRVWQARLELQTAVDGAALAAVQEYNINGEAAARQAAVDYAAANFAGDQSVFVDPNVGNAPSGDVVLGTITGAGPLVFTDSATPLGCSPGTRIAVLVRSEHQIFSIVPGGSLFGGLVGPYPLQARSIAQLDCSGGTPRLVLATGP
jgi:uncharacterized membrane protein